MIKVCFVRGKYLNNFEGQNYLFDRKSIQFTAVSSLFPIHRRFPFPVKKYLSPVDVSFIGAEIKYIGNRLIGDAQILFGLEGLADKYDIFHTADPHYYYSYQLARLRQKNLIKKLIITSWETIPFNNETVQKKKRIKYFTLSQADYFICYTEKAKSALIKEGVDTEKISVIKLGVNIDRFKLPNPKSKVPKKSQISNSKFQTITLLFVGRLVEEKGVMDLYEAYKEVKWAKNSKVSTKGRSPSGRKIQNLKLKIIGEGVLRRRLIQMIQRDGLINDITIEKREYDEMTHVYQEADIFVLPSKRTKTWEEQYGMVLVEAMAAGLPIVAYNTGAIEEVVDKAGILVKEGDKKSLVTSINHLIGVESLREKLGKMGRERAEKYFDAEKTAKKIAEIYKIIANN